MRKRYQSRMYRALYPPYGKGRFGLDYLPGTGSVPISRTGSPYRGGIFGQPPMPQGRYGIFKSYWGLPPSMSNEDTGFFTPHMYKRIPGSSMDTGRHYTPLVREPLGALTPEEQEQVRAAGGALLRNLGEKMYGPPALANGRTYAEGMQALEQRMRGDQKRAWVRAGLIVAAFLIARRK